MTDVPDLYFCDLCNTSVPLPDLENGRARRFKGKVIGSCCADELMLAERHAAGRPGLVTLGVIVLAAVAGATVFLDWRVSEEFDRVRGRVDELAHSSGEQTERLVSVEQRLGTTAGKEDLTPFSGGLDDVRAGLQRAQVLIEAAAARSTSLAESVGQVAASQQQSAGELNGKLDRVGEEVGRLAAEVASLKAMPRVAAPPPAVADVVSPRPSMPQDEPAGLPPALQHHVTQLGDADPGVRFLAVDGLLASKDPEVLPHLLPMVKDADPFVRRLTVEGLGSFRSAGAVEALLTALADPEGIVRHAAFVSLKALSKQNLSFDAEGSPEDRAAAQRRWQQWWDKNRASFAEG